MGLRRGRTRTWGGELLGGECNHKKGGFTWSVLAIGGIAPRLRCSMFDADSFQYAMENTEVIVAPQRRIETFGSTSFRFYLVSELMDSANQVRVRDGRLHADRPQIIAPGHLDRMLLEGFGEKAEQFMQWLQRHAGHLAVLKYGFQFRKTEVTESLVHSPVEEVIDRLKEAVDYSEDPLSAVIRGVDEGWEVSLLKFASDLIQESSAGNMGDFRRRGLF